MKRIVMHTVGGMIEIDVEGPGHVDLWSMPLAGDAEHIGMYDNEVDALDDVEAQVERGRAPGRWVITSAAPGERLVPCFAAGMSGAQILGYAATRARAKEIIGREVAYRPDGFGPDGSEGWEPA